MKVLLDSCVWSLAKADLAAAGHSVEWVGDWEEDPGDENILQWAARHEHLIVTLDKDFGELAVVRGWVRPSIVRLVDIPARQQGKVCVGMLNRFSEELKAGALLTVQLRRVRVRRLGGR